MNRKLKAAHQKGRQAQIDGQPLAENPYKREDYQTAWDDGWMAAADEVRPVHHVVQEAPVETLGTVTNTPYYYYKMPKFPCPKCKALDAPPPVQHRRAVVALNSSRVQALMHCRACEHRFILPVKYPPHG